MQYFPSRAAWIAVLLLAVVFVPHAAFAQGSARARAQAAVADTNYTEAARLYEDAIKESPKDKSVYIEAGDVNMELERYSQAQADYSHAVDIDGKDPVALRKLGAAYSMLGNHPKAIETIRKAVKYDESSVDSYLALGNALINAGKDSLNNAELTLITASQKYPNSAQVRVALGDLYFARGVYELAMTKYEEALQIDPNLIEPRVRLGRSDREMAKRAATLDEANVFYNKALSEFNTVTAKAPKNARAWYEQGEILMLAKEYDKAGQTFEQYVKLRPDDPRGDIMLSTAAYEGKFYQQAVEPLERVLAKSDSTSRAFQPQARAMLAKSYYAVKQYAKSRDMYALVADTAMDDEATKLYGSSILLSGGDTTKALSIYRKLLDAHPQDCSLSMSFGNLLYTMKRWDDVIDVFTKRLATCPNEPKGTPYLYIGLANYTQKRYDQAIQALTSATQADTSMVQAYYWLMNAYATNKQFDKSAEVAKEMIDHGFEKTNPKEVSTAHFFLGKSKFDAKDYKGAVEEFDQASKLNPESAQNYLFAAFAYQFQSDKDNACKYYRLVLKYDPQNADAKKNMKALGCQ
jgi:tetratricopeptide (TPR) repeat protein